MHHARPHLSVHSRSRRHSAVSGAAYRMRLRLFDDRAKRWRDYRPRRHVDRVIFANTIAPAGSPAWATDPALLWNIVEAAEQRKDSQIARDYRIPVPRGVPEGAADLLPISRRVSPSGSTRHTLATRLVASYAVPVVLLMPASAWLRSPLRAAGVKRRCAKWWTSAIRSPSMSMGGCGFRMASFRADR